MRIINPEALAQSIQGGSGEQAGDVIVKTTVGDLFDLVRPAGPVKPLPPHIDVNMPVELGPKTWPKLKFPFFNGH